MTDQDDLSLGNIAKKGLGFISDTFNSMVDPAEYHKQKARENAMNRNRTTQRAEIETSSCCLSCGSALTPNAKFCPECGAPQIDSSSNAPGVAPVQSNTASVLESAPQTRVNVYEGSIHKCPNCGEVVDTFDAVCSSCGFRIAERSASTAAQRFNMQLLEIEKERNPKGLLGGVASMFDRENIKSADKQIVNLINTFPIPNTVEEISEFMFMAVSNINPKYSKKTLMGHASDTPEKAISDAWVAKMQQLYNKAKLSFSGDPAFAHIEQLYLEKMNELKMKP